MLRLARGLAPLILAASLWGQSPPVGDLTDASLEDLLRIKVTSVSKKEQSVARSAAAVFVITQEDIRRSGANSIPEVLRMAPGLHVARVSSSKWAVTSRGFNGLYADKLLVMIDGRSVYSMEFSGVHWETLGVLLEDIDRIEVMRGPAGAMWGANSVNGIINIITKPARETQGGLLSAGGGNEQPGFGAVRYGVRLGETAQMRGYTKQNRRGELQRPDGMDAGDAGRLSQGGVRIDWQATKRDSFSFQTNAFATRLDDPTTQPSLLPPYVSGGAGVERLEGGDILGTWRRELSETSAAQFQFSYTKLDWRRPDLAQPHETIDLDFQHRFLVKGRHDVLWGGGYRLFRDETVSSFSIAFRPASVRDSLFSVFLQDEIELKADRLYLTGGAKLERNDYTGVEVSPSLRLLWAPDSRQSFWTAVSRSVGLPGRAYRHVRFNSAVIPMGPGRPPGVASLIGQPELGANSVLAWEAGYRNRLTRRLSLDVSAFRNRYRQLAAAEPSEIFFEQMGGTIRAVIPAVLRDSFAGRSAGVETLLEWKPAERVRLSASHSFLSLATYRDGERPSGAATADGRLPPARAILDGRAPRHQGQLRAWLDLPRGWEWDSTFHAVGALPDPRLAGYGRTDTRLGWRGRGGLDISLVVQNLLDRRHIEFLAEDLRLPVQRRRSGYAKITWSF